MHLLLVKYVRVVELDVFGVQELLDRRVKRVGWGRVGERHLSVLVVLVESKYSTTVVLEIDGFDKGAINGVYLFFHAAAAGLGSCDSCKGLLTTHPASLSPSWSRVQSLDNLGEGYI
jgi:hypothetical protein